MGHLPVANALTTPRTSRDRSGVGRDALPRRRIPWPTERRRGYGRASSIAGAGCRRPRSGGWAPGTSRGLSDQATGARVAGARPGRSARSRSFARASRRQALIPMRRGRMRHRSRTRAPPTRTLHVRASRERTQALPGSVSGPVRLWDLRRAGRTGAAHACSDWRTHPAGAWRQSTR